MVEPAKDENKTQSPAQKTPDPKDGGKSQPKPAAPVRRGGGLIGKFFVSLVLLLVVLGAAGYAALIFRDKDERIKVAADYIENELGQAQELMNTAPARIAGLLGGKKTAAPEDNPDSASSPAPAVESAQSSTASTEPAASEKPAALTPIEGDKAADPQKTAEQPKASEPLKTVETPPPAPTEAQQEPPPAPEPVRRVETPRPVESAPIAAVPEVKTGAPDKDELSASDLVHALEGRVEALSEELKSLREKLDQPKNETRATPVAGGSASEAATVVIAFALQKELDAGRPYADEIAALTRTGADPNVLGVLAPMAESGAPTGAKLRELFKPLAKKFRAEEPTEEQDLASHIIHGASKLVHVRPAGTDHPETLDGNLAKIDAALTHDNFVAAAAAFAAMPEWARTQAGEFAQTLDKRAAIAKAAEDLLHGAIAGLGGVKK